MSLKVSKPFVDRFREFCDANAFAVGKFVEQQLSDLMEDFHFGRQAQRTLSSGDTRRAKLPEILRRRR